MTVGTRNDYGIFVPSEKSSCTSVAELLCWQARHRPDDRACVVVDRDGQEVTDISYAGLDRRARAVARHLQELGIVPGQRALLAFPTGVDFLVGLFACAYAGVVAVPVPSPGEGAASGHARLTGIIADATPSAVLTTEDIAASPEAYGLSGIRAVAVALVSDELAGEFREPVGGHGSDSPVLIQYTSGSTGSPKGVVICHGNVLSNLHDVLATIPLMPPDGETLRCVSWLPLFHDMGLGQVITTLFSGGMVVLLRPASFLLRPALWLELITRYRAHFCAAPGSGYDLCSQRVTTEQLSGLDLSSVLFALNGSEPVRAETLENFARTFAVAGFDPESFVPCYGLAEGTFFVSGGRGYTRSLTLSVPALEREGVIRAPAAGEQERRVVSCGPVAAGIKARIIRPGVNQECGDDEVGEVWLAGSNVTRGYWRQGGERLPDRAEQPFLRTGDLGFSRDGELYILGRHDDVITLAGRHHYPQDIELTAELSHGALASGRVVAFGYQQGDTMAVAVVAETARKVRVAAPGLPAGDGLLDGDEVVSQVRSAVSREHQIRLGEVVLLRPAGLPRTTSGKLQRGLCRELFLAGRLKKW